MKQFKYPEDFYSFKDGASISKEEITVEINRMLKYLINNPEKQFSNWSTGDTQIIIFKYPHNPENNDGHPFYYEINVMKDYDHVIVWGKDIND